MAPGALSLMAAGAIVAAQLVAALFFLRFWRETRDRLFLFFAAAFLILGVNRVGLAGSAQHHEGDLVFYVVRLASFVLILIAIVDKNRKARGA